MLPCFQTARLTCRAGLLLTAIALTSGLASAQDEPPPEQPRVREIRVYVSNFYTEEQADESGWARFWNDLRIPTRESVIRTAILFKEGEPLDPELIEATERALRRQRFLNKAEIKVIPVDAETVDVEVHTQDAWSLIPGLDVEGGGGLTTLKGHLMELNLLGFGKKAYVEAIYESDVGTTWKGGYQDYQILGSRWVGGATYKQGPLVKALTLNLNRPLYSLDTKWSYGANANIADQIIRRFEDGEESDRFEKDQILVTAYVKRSFGRRFHKRSVKLKIKYKEADYSSLGSATTVPPPPDQANVTPIIGFGTEDISWTRNTYINKMGSTEDDWLGLRTGASAGYGIPVGDGFELWDVGGYVVWRTALPWEQFLQLSAVGNSEVVRNHVAVLKAKYYKKFGWHTVAFHGLAKMGWNLDSSRQFQLGADSGLRGFPARQFTGDYLLLFNFEDRQYWGTFPWGPEVAMGTVVFVDVGDAWPEEEEIDMNPSAGLGLRLGFTRLPHQPIFRLDFGFPLLERDWALTIGMEQQF